MNVDRVIAEGGAVALIECLELLVEAVTHEPATVGGSDLLAPVERDFWT